MQFPSFFRPLQNCQASVIWPVNCERDMDIYALFRKRFSVKEAKTLLRIFADTYYNLYIDGHFLHRGPVRRHESHAEYDTLPLYLTPGEHTIAVLVHHLGVECAAHRKGAKAFWCELESGSQKIISDSSWKAAYCSAFRTTGYIFTHYDFSEDVDMRLFPTNWEQPDFDDSNWAPAEVLCQAASEQDIHKNYTARTLKLFSYPRETGRTIQTGYYADTLPDDRSHVDRFLTRSRNGESHHGSYVLTEFSATISGCAEIHYEAVDGDTEIIIGYDDGLDADGWVHPGRAGECADRFLVPRGSGIVKAFMPRGFRYVLADISGSGKIHAVIAEKEEYPYEEKRGFSAGLTWWSELYDQSVRTQQVCTIDGFTDCVNRERVLWLGDAYLDCLGAYYATADRGLLLTTLYEHAMGESECGALGGYNSSDLRPDWLYMPAYNLMFIHILCDYILFTGDEENVRPLKSTVRGILRFMLDNLNDRGVFDSTWKGCNNYWDWGYAEPDGESLKANAYLIHTVDRMSSFPFFADVLDENLLQTIGRLKEVCQEGFWHEAKQVYRDTAGHDLTTQAASAYAVLAGLCPPEQVVSLLLRITDEALLDAIPVGENQENENSEPDYEKILPAATMYGATVVCRTLFENQMFPEALRYMRTVWGDFEGLPTLPELRRNGSNNTMCHGWSASPAFLLPMFVLGLRPTQPGCSELLFAPPVIDPALLSQAKGSMPTPFGTVYAQWARSNDYLKADFTIPKGVTLKLSFGGRELVFTESGNHTVFLPGV